ncbi:MAG: ATP-binding cassette domain-containing protein [Spirochaetaceae bacterium]|nr:ATP-binding cassette domain-containing protein [Spirochaetaceae bacterium]
MRHGEIVAYAGPNGAGKSTTVKLLSSVLAPTAGTVCCLGMDPMKDRVRYVGRIGVVFGQRTELWWDQPVAASFEWKRVVWNIPRDRYESMLAFVKELLGIGEFFNTLARQLSLGEKMRADLALMLMHEPEILFLDEPTIGVDVLAKRNILQFVKDLNREKGGTVMITSHDMDELEQLAERIVIIDRGRIAFDGDFEALRRRSATAVTWCWRPRRSPMRSPLHPASRPARRGFRSACLPGLLPPREARFRTPATRHASAPIGTCTPDRRACRDARSRRSRPVRDSRS